MTNNDWRTLLIFLAMVFGIVFGGYKVIQSINDSDARMKATLKNRVAFCQSLTIPKESNACLARIALGEN